ncbi:Ig-like domain-containing protein [Streptomyces sp. TRM76323]|uniref:Ig-like domain-containing protein n=1 Tax=Streptomyces tamarix TaxID=3078565 RepID=A0ABU3QKX6_9ACTN|nr:Ig-like domain-containing protein [Streptomyces tamarix]MDT9683421.1 Ig-like domain-containing protein [Streptomyces tamarix]
MTEKKLLDVIYDSAALSELPTSLKAIVHQNGVGNQVAEPSKSYAVVDGAIYEVKEDGSRAASPIIQHIGNDIIRLTVSDPTMPVIPVAVAEEIGAGQDVNKALLLGFIKSVNEMMDYFPAHSLVIDYTGEFSGSSEPEGISVSGISLDKTANTIKVGDSVTAIATITPDNATNKNIVWDSSDKSVVTVDSNGKYTGVKAGTSDVSATTEDGSRVAVATITVTEA